MASSNERNATTPQAAPNPGKVIETFFGVAKAYALKAAVDLDIFTTMSDGPKTVEEVAKRADASERGIRVLCDFLAAHKFLNKHGERYSLTAESAAFLDRHSPMFMGTLGNFLLSDYSLQGSKKLKDSIIKGGTTVEHIGLTPEHPMWVEFARSMAPMMALPASLASEKLGSVSGKVIDIAAGHGLYGLMVARQNPGTEVFAVDWPNVLQVATENAATFGVTDRYHPKPGSAFEVELGKDNSLVLVPNFLHHFDIETNEEFLRKVHACLKPGGRVAIVEFVPNEDRISPTHPAGFALTMLAQTPAGNAYTQHEWEQMLSNAGFRHSISTALEPTPSTLIVAEA